MVRFPDSHPPQFQLSSKQALTNLLPLVYLAPNRRQTQFAGEEAGEVS